MTKDEYIVRRDSDRKILLDANAEIVKKIDKLISVCESGEYSKNTNEIENIQLYLGYLKSEIGLQNNKLNGD